MEIQRTRMKMDRMSRLKWPWVVALVAGCVCITTSAAAQDKSGNGTATRFGNAGTLALGGSLSVTQTSGTLDVSDVKAEGSQTSVSAAPQLDWFVTGGLSLGLSAAGSYGRYETKQYNPSDPSRSSLKSSGRLLGIRPSLRVGYYFPLGEHVGFWPVVHGDFGYTSMHVEVSGSDGVTSPNSGSSTTKQLGLDAQIVFHVADHWFLHVAPGLAYVSSNRNEGMYGPLGGTTGGLLSGVAFGFGGWM